MAVIQGRGQLTDRTFPTNPRRDNKDMENIKSRQEYFKLSDGCRAVAKAYADSHEFSSDPKGERNLSALVTMDGWDDFCKGLRLIGQYNGFEPATVIKSLKVIAEDCTLFMIGREGSPAVYLQLPRNIAEQVVIAHESARCDECDIVQGGLLRLWWD